MEKRIIDRVSRATKALGLPRPEDARARLARNAKGKKWKNRDPEALQGLVWHQELGWGTVEAVARDSPLDPRERLGGAVCRPKGDCGAWFTSG